MPIHPILLKIRRKKALAIGAACLLVLLICLSVYLCLPMPAGAAVDSFDLSGLPYWKALSEVKALPIQTVEVVLPDGGMDFTPTECGVKINYAAALWQARKEKTDISLRPYLKADEAGLRQALKKYAEWWDTTYQETSWELKGTAPDLRTDRFEPEAEGEVRGAMELSYNGKVYATVDLLAMHDVEADRLLTIWRDVKAFFARTSVRVALIVLLVLLVLFLVWKLLLSRRRYRYGRSVGYSRSRNYRGRRK